MAQVLITDTLLNNLADAAGHVDSELTLPNTLANITTALNNLTIVNYYTGTSNPSSSLGNNGDIYLQTPAE